MASESDIAPMGSDAQGRTGAEIDS